MSKTTWAIQPGPSKVGIFGLTPFTISPIFISLKTSSCNVTALISISRPTNSESTQDTCADIYSSLIFMAKSTSH